MKKAKLYDWMRSYLILHGAITLEAVNLLYGPIEYGSFTGRISEMRSKEGMRIKNVGYGAYKLIDSSPRVMPFDDDEVEQTAAPVETYETQRVNDLTMEVNGIKQEIAALTIRLQPLLSMLKGPF